MIRYIFVFALGFVFLTGHAAKPGRTDASPYVFKPRQDAWLVSAAVGGVLGGMWLRTQSVAADEKCIGQLNKADINGFDRHATSNWSLQSRDLTDVALMATFAGGLPLVFSDAARDDKWVIALMAAETVLLTWSAAQLSKSGFSRTRPYAYNPAVPDHERLSLHARESFYSRTTSLAFASAVFCSTLFDAYYPESAHKKWVWVGSLGFASLTAYLSVDSGNHFPTDVIAGALTGSLIGWLVPRIHQNKETPLSITPATNGREMGLMLRYEF